MQAILHNISVTLSWHVHLTHCLHSSSTTCCWIVASSVVTYSLTLLYNNYCALTTVNSRSSSHCPLLPADGKRCSLPWMPPGDRQLHTAISGSRQLCVVVLVSTKPTVLNISMYSLRVFIAPDNISGQFDHRSCCILSCVQSRGDSEYRWQLAALCG